VTAMHDMIAKLAVMALILVSIAFSWSRANPFAVCLMLCKGTAFHII
jgi:hypothetical protein